MTAGPTSLPPAPPGGAWLQLAMQAVTTVGVPTVFAGILLWFVLTRLGDTLDHIVEHENTREQTLVTMQEKLMGAVEKQTQSFEAAMRDIAQSNRELATTISAKRGTTTP